MYENSQANNQFRWYCSFRTNFLQTDECQWWFKCIPLESLFKIEFGSMESNFCQWWIRYRLWIGPSVASKNTKNVTSGKFTIEIQKYTRKCLLFCNIRMQLIMRIRQLILAVSGALLTLRIQYENIFTQYRAGAKYSYYRIFRPWRKLRM